MDIIYLYCFFCYACVIPILHTMNEVWGRNILASIAWFILAPLTIPIITGMIISEKIN